MITLKQIRDNKPCEDSWTELLESFNKTKADDTIVTCQHLLETLDIDDTLWVIHNCIGGKRTKKRHMVADIAERVLHIWEKWAKDNAPDHFNAPRKAVDAVRNGKVNDEILKAAEYAWDAGAAYAGAYAAGVLAARADADTAADVDCAWSAGAAAYAAADVDCAWDAGAAAYAAACAYAGALADDGALAARAASDAADYAAAAEREEQKKIILTHFGE
tara:strand:+ start:25 stop:678 length:654 start_codon:yes stop_codon:yes gene_type:complete